MIASTLVNCILGIRGPLDLNDGVSGHYHQLGHGLLVPVTAGRRSPFGIQIRLIPDPDPWRLRAFHHPRHLAIDELRRVQTSRGKLSGTEEILNHVPGGALTAVDFTGAKHYATRDHSSGFAVFNDVALTAKALLDDPTRWIDRPEPVIAGTAS